MSKPDVEHLTNIIEEVIKNIFALKD